MKKTFLLCLFAALLTFGFAQKAVNSGKVSGYLAAMVTQYADNDRGEAVAPKSVKALVSLTQTCDAGAFFARHDCRLIDNVGRIYIVDIPLNAVAALSFNDTIERIEAERMPRPAMDVTPQQVNATDIYAGLNLPQAYTGAGVAAGVFDCYYDFTHPAFQDANGDLRVQYYYDFHWPNADGTFCHALETAAEIAAYEHSQNTRNGIHGTHVMGIINGISSGQIIDIDLVTSGNQLVRFDFFGIQLVGGGIEGTITFNTSEISPTEVSHFTANVSMGLVQLDVSVSPYQDPRGTVYHIQGTMPNLAYLMLCGAAVLLTSDNPAWMYSDISLSPFSNVTSVPQYCFAQSGYSVSWPATLPGVIAVGATGYKPTFTNIAGQTNTDMEDFAPAQIGQITTFSSCGPTFDGRVKPDVVAPGLNISAAYNSYYADFATIQKNLTHTVQVGNKNYYYLAESGTSMAAPVVAGIIALWLQAKPNLTPEQALEVISQTCTHPDNTMTYPNNTYGYGQIDAYNGLLRVLELPDHIPDFSDHQPQGVTFRLENRTLYADFGDAHPKHIEFQIYTLNSSLVKTVKGKDHVNLSALKDGVYAVQLITDSPLTTGSTLIRL